MDWLVVILLLLILFFLIGQRRAEGPGSNEFSRLDARLDALGGSIEQLRRDLGEHERDQEILDELEVNVMEEWAQIIEEKLGKRPIRVPCPNCGYTAGLEPNLLADEDVEYGCPSCGEIFELEKLRTLYPDADI